MRNEKNLILGIKSRSEKNSLVRWISSNYGGWIDGFTTKEIKSGGKRTGFELSLFSGEREILASVEIVSPVKFNKYAVNLKALDLAAESVRNAVKKPKKIVFMDEVGAISLKSEKLLDSIMSAISSDKPALLIFRQGAQKFERTFASIANSMFLDVTLENSVSVRKNLDEWFDFWIRSLSE